MSYYDDLMAQSGGLMTPQFVDTGSTGVDYSDPSLWDDSDETRKKKAANALPAPLASPEDSISSMPIGGQAALNANTTTSNASLMDGASQTIPDALASPDDAVFPMPANDKLQEDIKKLAAKKPPGFWRQLAGAAATAVPIVGPTLGRNIVDPNSYGEMREIDADKALAANELATFQKQYYAQNILSEAQKRRMDAIESAARLAALTDSRNELRQQQYNAAGGTYLPNTPIQRQDTLPDALPSPEAPPPGPGPAGLNPQSVTPQGPQQQGPPIGDPLAALRMPRQPLPPVTAPASFRVPPNYNQVPNAPGTPPGQMGIVPTPDELARQKKAGALEAAQANEIPLPPAIAAAFGMDPNTKVDPAHLPAYLTAYTTYQTADKKSLPEQVKERVQIAEQLGMTGRDRETYIAEGKLEHPNVNQFNLSAMPAAGSPEDTQAQMIANYQVPMPTPRSATPNAMAAMNNLLQRVKAVNPNFQATQYPVFQSTEQKFTNGSEAASATAINTVSGHLAILSSAAEALKNNDLRALNAVANSLGVQVGRSPVTTYKTIVNRVSPELVKAYVGSIGGGEQDRRQAADDFSANNSPEQLRNAIGVTAQLLQGKAKNLKAQYDRGTYGRGKQQLLTDEADATLQRLAGAPTGMVNVISPEGVPGQIPADKLDAAIKRGFKKQ